MSELTEPVIKKKGSEFSEARIREDAEIERAIREEEDITGGNNGRPAHIITDATRTAVTLLSGFGVPQVKIANYIGLKSDVTLRKHYREQLDNAETNIDAAVIGAWMKNIQAGKEITVLRYMERKFLKPDTSHIPQLPSPEQEELTKETMREIIKEIQEEF